MALHARAQCTARLLLAHQQKQGRQPAVADSEEKSMREDWSVLADLGMEERVKGGWYVCVLRPVGYRLIVLHHPFTLKVARRGA
jgi:hypothetical protein